MQVSVAPSVEALNRAWILFGEAKYAEAEDQLKRIVASEPGLPQAWRLPADVYYFGGKSREGGEYLRSLDTAGASYAQGRIAERNSDHETARKELRRCIEWDPDAYPCFDALAGHLRIKGDAALSVDEAKRLLAVDFSRPRGKRALLHVYMDKLEGATAEKMVSELWSLPDVPHRDEFLLELECGAAGRIRLNRHEDPHAQKCLERARQTGNGCEPLGRG